MQNQEVYDELMAKFEKLYGVKPAAVAYAPGRIEVLGNHTDYNNGFTMGAAIDKVVMVALSKRNDRKLCFASIKSGEKVELDLDKLEKQPREYNWVNYPLGVFKFLVEAGLQYARHKQPARGRGAKLLGGNRAVDGVRALQALRL